MILSLHKKFAARPKIFKPAGEGAARHDNGVVLKKIIVRPGNDGVGPPDGRRRIVCLGKPKPCKLPCLEAKPVGTLGTEGKKVIGPAPNLGDFDGAVFAAIAQETGASL